jgi:hypothetical protein
MLHTNSNASVSNGIGLAFKWNIRLASVAVVEQATMRSNSLGATFLGQISGARVNLGQMYVNLEQLFAK